MSNPSRRTLLQGLAAGGAALPLLSACGTTGGRTGPIRTRDVPVGGGTIYTDEQVVVTQPAKGSYRAFSAICTHQGCMVGEVSHGAIECPCHGSAFSIKDGSVLQGPASRPLPKKQLTVDGDRIRVT